MFNLPGLVYVTLPGRIAVGGLLALRRRWWHMAAFAGAVVMPEVLIGLLKGIYPPSASIKNTRSSAQVWRTATNTSSRPDHGWNG